MRLARERRELYYGTDENNTKTNFYYHLEMMKKRKLFDEVKRILRSKSVSYSMRHPAILRIEHDATFTPPKLHRALFVNLNYADNGAKFKVPPFLYKPNTLR